VSYPLATTASGGAGGCSSAKSSSRKGVHVKTMRVVSAAAAMGMLALGCAGRPTAGNDEPKRTAATKGAGAATETKPAAQIVNPPAVRPTEINGKTSPKCSEAEAGTQPVDAMAMVRQLGDADFAKREAASAKLAAMGESALAALRSGADSKDAEVASRCRKLIAQIKVAQAEPELPEIPKGLRKSFRWNWNSVWRGGHGPGAAGPRIIIRGAPGVRFGKFRRTGQDMRSFGNSEGKVSITVNSDGRISLVVTPKGGKSRSYTYKAASKEEFAKKYPKFAAKYLQEKR
jgi:hypothetical protein